jgi:hypothetical protein
VPYEQDDHASEDERQTDGDGGGNTPCRTGEGQSGRLVRQVFGKADSGYRYASKLGARWWPVETLRASPSRCPRRDIDDLNAPGSSSAVNAAQNADDASVAVAALVTDDSVVKKAVHDVNQGSAFDAVGEFDAPRIASGSYRSCAGVSQTRSTNERQV